MKKWLKSIIILAVIAIIGTMIFLSHNKGSAIESKVETGGNSITFSIGEDKLVVQVCTDEILKVHYLPQGESTLSTEVIGKTTFEDNKAVVDTETNPMTITTAKMRVEIDIKTNEISIYDSNNKLLTKAQDINKIPIDNYTLDFDWKAWGEDNYGEFRWNTTNFPGGATGELKEMMSAKGIKLTAIMKPRIHVDTIAGKYLDDNKFFLESKGASVDYFSKKMVEDVDFSKPEARTWFYDNTKKAMDSGIVGWWNDEADEKSPNLQFLNMQKALYEGQRGDSNTRVWSLNRNFYLGAQKYAYGMWSGDINTGFETMATQRDVMLSAMNVGEAKWGMDTGGFHGTPEPENYARWVEFSAFVPIFRVHGVQNELRQPWVYGTTAEAAATKAINLRYSLIPYIYTYDRQAYDTGIGLVRPLIFDYPKDKNVANYVDDWMFGENLLVAPVVDKAQTEKEIYLPKGTWIDYFNGTKYEGGQNITYKINSNTWEDIPLFIKKGAIIPSNAKAIQNVEEKVDSLYLDVFPDTTESTFKYYDDDGKTYNYEKGEYLFQNMKTQDKGNSIIFDIAQKEGSYTSDTKYYICKVHGSVAKDVKLGGKSLTQGESLEKLMNADSEAWGTGKDVYGDVTYIKVNAQEEKSIEIVK